MSSRTITTLFWWTSDLLQLWQNRPILKQGVWERHRAVVSTCDQSWIPTQVCSHLPSRKISTLTSCPSELLQLWQKRPILNTWVYSPTITFTFMCRMCSFEVSSLQTDKKNQSLQSCRHTSAANSRTHSWLILPWFSWIPVSGMARWTVMGSFVVYWPRSVISRDCQLKAVDKGQM